MTKIIELFEDLTVSVEIEFNSENVDETENEKECENVKENENKNKDENEKGGPSVIKYTFTLKEKLTNKTDSITIIVNEKNHIDFNNVRLVEKSKSNSLMDSGKKYRDLGELEELSEIHQLLPFVLYKFGIKYNFKVQA